MKKYFFILFLAIFSLISLPKAFAAITPTPTDAPSPTDSIQNQIDDLKNKIASRVAQLNLVEKRGIIGTVSDISDTQITLTDLNGNTRFVDVDELTKFNSSSSNSYGISDISKGSTIGVIGLYNKDSKRLLARSVDQITSLPKFLIGGIADMDKVNYTLTVKDENNKNTNVDIQDITKTYSFSSGTLTKSGFSKLTTGLNVIVAGFLEKDNKTISAGRVIVFPDISLNPKINIEAPVVPSTGSGKKLTPIVK